MIESMSNMPSHQKGEPHGVRIPGWLLLLYVTGIIYGSLIPFELRPYTLSAALDQFIHIRFLDLGVVSRADWIANILLYIPLGGGQVVVPQHHLNFWKWHIRVRQY